MELALEVADRAFVALVERPLPDPLGRNEARPGELLEMGRRGGLGYAQFVGDEDHANAVRDEVSVALRREIRDWIAEPIKDLHPFRARERAKNSKGVACRGECRHVAHRNGRLCQLSPRHN